MIELYIVYLASACIYPPNVGAYAAIYSARMKLAASAMLLGRVVAHDSGFCFEKRKIFAKD